MALHNLLKRKGLLRDDFSDFPLSSPATKIRRLDAAELPPIVEEEEPLPLPLPNQNQERALVLFKPLLHHSPSSFSITLDSDLISEIKNKQYPWSNQRDSDCERLLGLRSHEEEQERNKRELALVPWVPSPSSRLESDSTANAAELMETDETGTMMDVEEEQEHGAAINSTASESTIQYPTTLNQNLHQQQHQGIGGITEGFPQHCLLPQFPQNTSTPITWTR